MLQIRRVFPSCVLRTQAEWQGALAEALCRWGVCTTVRHPMCTLPAAHSLCCACAATSQQTATLVAACSADAALEDGLIAEAESLVAEQAVPLLQARGGGGGSHGGRMRCFRPRRMVRWLEFSVWGQGRGTQQRHPSAPGCCLLIGWLALAVQEPLLVSLEQRAPTWEGVGGVALVDAAVAAGGYPVLLQL